MKPIVVTVTNQMVGVGEIYPYDRHMKAVTLPFYTVPQYLIDVNGARKFKALRFGLRYKPGPLLKERVCDVGLFHAAVLDPEWVYYDTHSFHSKGIKGAWRLKPKEQFLLHEGAGEQDLAGASLGCIELTGAADWNQFLHVIQTETGVNDFAEIAKKKLLKVVITEAIAPKATYLRSWDINAQHYFIEPTQ